MLLGTVQVVARLHRTSMVAAVADDAVHRVAEAGPDVEAARARADRRVHRLLGPAARVRWSTTADGPTVEIIVPSPPLPGLVGDIRRGASARWERLR
ncbi:MAG TPA: hypothetical protein VID94_08040 [Acidimicrobiales bacterium]|jgi:hypothetical protein